VLQESYDMSGYSDNPRDISPGVYNSKNSRKQIYIVLYVEMHKLDAFLALLLQAYVILADLGYPVKAL
jgi:hypothetical protein